MNMIFIEVLEGCLLMLIFGLFFYVSGSSFLKFIFLNFVFSRLKEQNTHCILLSYYYNFASHV